MTERTNPGPREVFERLISGVSEQRWDQLADLYAEDAVVEHPFAIPGPSRLVGREQLREHFAAGVASPVRMEARNIVIHETADPEVIIGEFEYHARVIATGRTFTFGTIFVLRVRDGEIVASRDYVNHLAIAAGIGRLSAVVAALSEDVAA